MSQYDRELEQIERDYENGHIDRTEMNEQIRDLDRAYQEDALARAMEAYERELERPW